MNAIAACVLPLPSDAHSAAALALKSVGFPLKDLNRNNTNEEEEENEEDTDDLYSSNSSKEMQAYRSFLDRFVKPPALQEMQKYLQVNSKRAKAFKNAAIFVREFTLPVRSTAQSPLSIAHSPLPHRSAGVCPPREACTWRRASAVPPS